MRREILERVVAGLLLAGAAPACRGDRAAEVAVTPGGSLLVRVDRAEAGAWHLMARSDDESLRLPATGALAAGDSLELRIGQDAPGHVVLELYRCERTTGADDACETAEAELDRNGGTWRLTNASSDERSGVALVLTAVDPPPVRILVNAAPVAFTSRATENEIPLVAELSGPARGGTVVWKVSPVPGAGGQGLDLDQPAPGERSVLRVPTRPRSKWRAMRHPRNAAERRARLDAATMRFRVAAAVEADGVTYHSDTVEIRQHDLAAVREEYVILGLPHGPPPDEWFRSDPAAGGDYPFSALEARFAERFRELKARWLDAHPASRWQVNALYRNPAHNAYHVSRGVGSGAVRTSWHQYGCAADLQTFPVPRRTAADRAEATLFWQALADEALLLGFQVEPAKSASGPYSGIGHVHIELDCPP